MNSEEDDRTIDLRTYTSLWQVEKRIYKIYDFSLPMPVSLRMLGIGAIITIPWFTLMWIVHMPFTIDNLSWMVWIAPPVVFAYLANRPIAEGKNLLDLLLSQFNFFIGQAHYYARLRPWNQPAYQFVAAYRWEPNQPTSDTPESEGKKRPGLAFRTKTDEGTSREQSKGKRSR